MNRLGHNLPPGEPVGDPLLERLNESHADLTERAAYLAEFEAKIPEVVTDANMAAVTSYANDIKACIRAARAAHKAEKEPFLAAGRKVDDWKNALTEPLSAILSLMMARLDVFADAKRKAEEARLGEEAKYRTTADLVRRHTAAGDMFTATDEVEFVVENKELAVCFFWEWIPDEALEQAIRRYKQKSGKALKQHLRDKPDAQPIPGVIFTLKTKAATR